MHIEKLAIIFLIISSINTNSQQIQIVWPNGGEVYYKGNMHEVRWRYLNMEPNDIEVYLSINDGQTWESIGKSNIYDNNLNFRPEFISHSCLIKLVCNDSSEVISDSLFKIKNPPQKRYNDDFEFININSIKMWMYNGLSGCQTKEYDSGFYWPYDIDTTLTAVYIDGLLIGGIKEEEPFVVGSFWRAGMQPGKINNYGLSDDPSLSEYKIWKIRKNWESELNENLKNELRYDYENWPVEIGAPWHDVDKNGIYNKEIDEPKHYGDETLYFVCNDLDTARSLFSYGSFPVGLEVHNITFGFDRTDLLRDVIFREFKIINKSKTKLKDVFISYNVDADLGNSHDDYTGCDTILNMGYNYNGTNEDYLYGVAPPAVGYMILKGAFDKRTNEDLMMSYFCPNFKNYSQLPMDQVLGAYEGTLHFYNNMRGLHNYGDPFIDPFLSDTAKKWLWGDPFRQTGWTEFDQWINGRSMSPGERRFLISSGPFDFAPNDTQTVRYAIFLARGESNLHSVEELKITARNVIDFYNSGFDSNFVVTNVVNNSKDNQLPTTYSLSQNYPNPFNPVTTIIYNIPVTALSPAERDKPREGPNVRLVIYDILGREVATLVNAKQKPGSYKVEWDASQHASGIYFYKLCVTLSLSKGRTNDFVKTNKMILLK